MKTVILVWTTNVCNYPKDDKITWGLGDLVRGTIHMYQLSKKLQFNLIVDIHLHPIHTCLDYDGNIDEYAFVDENAYNIPFVINVEKFLVAHNENKFCVLTNDWFQEPITDECKNFIKSILQPNKTLEQRIELTLHNLPFKNYNILHYRLGDDLLVRGSNENNTFDDLLAKLRTRSNSNTLFISDSESFKSFTRSQTNTFMLNTIVRHIGFDKHGNELSDTLLEFFIMTKADYIQTYSVYCWMSGFVSIAKNVYGIPTASI